ncbi:MAG: hypothetical protein HY608_10480 [Planctomycetes bacterium]|nr:hypothetical protein [Planctomycetota bacterium]
MSAPALGHEAILHLQKLSRQLAATSGEEWGRLTGQPVFVEAGTIGQTDVKAPPAAFLKEATLHTTARIEGGAQGTLRILLPFSAALVLSGRMLLLKDGIVRRKIASSQEVDLDTDAYREAMNIFCGGAGRAFSSMLEVDLSVVQERTRVSDLRSRKIDLDLLFPPLPWVVFHFQAESPPFPKAPLALVMDLDTARSLLPARSALGADGRRTILVLALQGGATGGLEGILPRTTYEVVPISGPAQLDMTLAQAQPHAVLVEVARDRTDRIDLCRELRARNVPVFACCGRTTVEKEFLLAVARSKVLGVLPMPFDPRTTLEKMESPHA